jgi:hypothetical protein
LFVGCGGWDVEGREGIERRGGGVERVCAWRIEGSRLICTAILNCSSKMVDRSLRFAPGAGNQGVERKTARALAALGTYGVD